MPLPPKNEGGCGFNPVAGGGDGLNGIGLAAVLEEAAVVCHCGLGCPFPPCQLTT